MELLLENRCQTLALCLQKENFPKTMLFGSYLSTKMSFITAFHISYIQKQSCLVDMYNLVYIIHPKKMD